VTPIVQTPTPTPIISPSPEITPVPISEIEPETVKNIIGPVANQQKNTIDIITENKVILAQNNKVNYQQGYYGFYFGYKFANDPTFHLMDVEQGNGFYYKTPRGNLCRIGGAYMKPISNYYMIAGFPRNRTKQFIKEQTVLPVSRWTSDKKQTVFLYYCVKKTLSNEADILILRTGLISNHFLFQILVDDKIIVNKDMDKYHSKNVNDQFEMDHFTIDVNQGTTIDIQIDPKGESTRDNASAVVVIYLP
jgi:hypothetical protein